MRILIIGGSGFIGKNLINHFHKFNNIKLKFTSSVKKNKNYIKYKIGDPLPLSIRRFKPEVLINTAWYGIPNFNFKNSYKNIVDNILFIKELKKLKTIKKIIVLGSCWEILNKDAIPKDTHYFIWAKNSINMCYEEFSRYNNIRYNWIRLFYVYGTGQKSKSLIPTIIENSNLKRETLLNNPNLSQDFIYIEDVVSIIKLIALSNKSFEINIGSGKLTKVKNIKKIVDKIINNKSIKIDLKRASHNNLIIKKDMKFIFDNFRWKPKYNIHNGLRDLLNKWL